MSKQIPEARQVHSAVEGKRRRPQRRAAKLEPRLSAAQTAAWVVPRIMVLFALGWAWSTGVQFIHAQQTGRRLPSGLFGDYDSSDSEDSDDFVRQGVTRDVLARVLGSARWANGVSGVLTVLVGLGYPFLDSKWQSFPRFAVEWHDVLRCVGGFLGVNYAMLKLPFESAHQSALLMQIIALGLWTVCDGTLHGLLLSTSASLSCTWLLYMHILDAHVEFARDDYASLLAFLPSVIFTYCVMTGSIGRHFSHWRPQP